MNTDTTLTALKSQHKDMWQAAQKIEGQFLAEMLKTSGFAKPSDYFGSAGESHFQSFLIEAQAKSLGESRSFGISEHIFEALLQRQFNGK